MIHPLRDLIHAEVTKRAVALGASPADVATAIASLETTSSHPLIDWLLKAGNLANLVAFIMQLIGLFTPPAP